MFSKRLWSALGLCRSNPSSNLRGVVYFAFLCSYHSTTQTFSLVALRARFSFKTACLCFNTFTSSTPAYLSDLLYLYSPSRSLRSGADIRLLKIPLYRCKTKGNRAFSYFGPSVWNSLPLHIRNATTIDTFKPALKTYLFNLQESD